MRLELTGIVMTGLGVSTNLEKLRENALSGENIKMSIDSVLRFSRPEYVECVVTVESASDSDAIRLKCSYTGSFAVDAGAAVKSDEHITISAACTAKIFPYIRELIADVTRRLPLAAPIILDPALADEKKLLEQMAKSQQQSEGETEKTQ